MSKFFKDPAPPEPDIINTQDDSTMMFPIDMDDDNTVVDEPITPISDEHPTITGYNGPPQADWV